MRLSALFVYPIKSLPGVSLAVGEVRRAGLRHDRRWMIADEAGTFLSLRTEPRLTQAEVALVDGGYAVRTPAGALVLPECHAGPLVPARVWTSHVEAVVHGEGSELVSAWLGRPLQLVHLPEHVVRRAGDHAADDDRVSLADAYPYLLTGEASLRDLADRIGDPALGMARFRPNFVMAGGEPYAEDHWMRVRIGERSFRAVKRCDRCVATTVHPRTGERGPEPLRTLARYRREHGKVWFGMNLVPDDEGELRVGDAVVVSEP